MAGLDPAIQVFGMDIVVHRPRVCAASVIFFGHLKAYKRYETGELRLYDLAKDLGEQHDLAKQMPAQAAVMERRMNEYLKAVNAQMATPNPHYDASKVRK